MRSGTGKYIAVQFYNLCILLGKKSTDELNYSLYQMKRVHIQMRTYRVYQCTCYKSQYMIRILQAYANQRIQLLITKSPVSLTSCKNEVAVALSFTCS